MLLVSEALSILVAGISLLTESAEVSSELDMELDGAGEVTGDATGVGDLVMPLSEVSEAPCSPFFASRGTEDVNDAPERDSFPRDSRKL